MLRAHAGVRPRGEPVPDPRLLGAQISRLGKRNLSFSWAGPNPHSQNGWIAVLESAEFCRNLGVEFLQPPRNSALLLLPDRAGLYRADAAIQAKPGSRLPISDRLSLSTRAGVPISDFVGNSGETRWKPSVEVIPTSAKSQIQRNSQFSPFSDGNASAAST